MIACLAGVLGSAGCATTASPEAASANAAQGAANTAQVRGTEAEYSTGSRIPNRAARDRMVNRVEGDAYARDRMNSTSSQPDPQ